ncbi:MAG TPA: SDR family oxidoreductase [Acidimicrobiia bacterium]|nr:SDR family oxidoreductase [Acidimicrobiia bacterium]
MIGPEAASLDGKVALVTGAARGIGAAAASALARFGADLAICDRDPAGMATTAADVEACGRRCETAELDVRDNDAVTMWLGVLAERYGTIDVLVNNAGGGFYAAVLDVNDKGQRSLVDENFTSVTNFVRGCVPLMPEGSSIVNITSIEASRAAPGFGVYAAMKAAVESLTKTLALELATVGIRVNALAPDAIPTPGDEDLAEAVSQGAREAYGRKVPLGWGHVDDCAGPIVFLASALSRYVTGTVLHVDGGSHAASGWARRDDGTYEP